LPPILAWKDIILSEESKGGFQAIAPPSFEVKQEKVENHGTPEEKHPDPPSKK